MNESRIRDGLLAAEHADPELERRYHERLQTLTERKLTAIERGSIGFGLVVALGTGAQLVRLFLQHRAEGRPVALVGLAVGLAFIVGWVWFSVALLRRGSELQLQHGNLRAQLIAAFTIALAGLMLWAGLETPDPARGNQMILFGLVFWTVLGLPFYIAQVVRQNELRVRMDLLRIELAFAEAAERREARL